MLALWFDEDQLVALDADRVAFTASVPFARFPKLKGIIEGRKRIPDPTIPIREKDDFGGENSILAINMKT